MACTPLLLALFNTTVPALTVTPRLPLSPVPLMIQVPPPMSLTKLLAALTEPALVALPVVRVMPEATFHVCEAATAMVSQFRTRFRVALARLIPLLSVKVALPSMLTGAAGLPTTIPFQVTALPKEFVQSAAVDTVEFQMALSPLPGAVPLTQLPPNCKAVWLLALV